MPHGNRNHCFFGCNDGALGKWLHRCGSFDGYADGSFRPDAAITRAEAVKILNRMLERSIEADRVCTPNKVGVQPMPGITDGKAQNGNRIFDGVEVDASGAAGVTPAAPPQDTTPKAGDESPQAMEAQAKADLERYLKMKGGN